MRHLEEYKSRVDAKEQKKTLKLLKQKDKEIEQKESQIN